MLSTYAPLLRDPAARLFLGGSVIGKLGNAMYGIALVTMVALRTGSFAVAGAVSAGGLVAYALTAVVSGRLIDRHGQRVVVLPLLAWSTAWVAVLLVASATHAPHWFLFVGYALASTVPGIGTLSRSRWTYLLRDRPGSVHSAMSLEQVTDELSFVLGPALAVLLATAWFPEAGLLVACLLYCGGTLLFLAERSTEPPVDPTGHRATKPAVRIPGIVLLSLILFMTGCIFGANEVTTVAVAKDLGRASAAGLIIALFAIGSATAGLLFGTRAPRRSLPTALAICTAGMFLLEAPILLTHRLVPLGAVLLLAGAATAPTLIVAMQLAQRLAPASQATEAMSVVLTGLLIGIAAGSGLAGWVIEALHPSAGYYVSVAAGASSFLLALAGRPLLKRG